jgi:hypothetical protein
MGYGMFIIGAIIFGLYMFLTLWNIVYSGKKQDEDNSRELP